MKKLQVKFVLMTTLCLTVILVSLVAVLNVLSYRSMVRNADWILSILAENEGQFPEQNNGRGPEHDHGNRPEDEKDKPQSETPDTLPDGQENPPLESLPDRQPPENKSEEAERNFYFSAELPHESRFFSILLNENNELIDMETSHIAAISDEWALKFAAQVAELEDERGFYGVYRYVKVNEATGLRIIFLDTSNTMGFFFRVMFNSAIIALVILLLVMVIISFMSNRVIKPIAESYEMQKRFISDAGHELKTPLTIIRADADVLEMDLGQNEWLEDIQRQTDRMSELTNNLLLLSRMEDTKRTTAMIDFPLSDTVTETVGSFETLAKARGRKLSTQIEPLLNFRGNERAISHLVSVLLENAIKYSPEGGEIRLKLERVGRTAQLTVFNTTMETLPKEALSRLFDRFYRVDSARNSGVGGHGIGLSLAKAITDAHRGKIQASIPGEKTIVFTVTLPL
ncbi:MAG: HAMP domain-containing histidine kinase [Ruminococcaceae bacterium]|nr:HAMP domain-containing histidine kinase [Oscillospiraceae bacterium]